MTREKGGFIPQAEVTGSPRNTHHQLLKNGRPETVYTPRISRVIMGINRFGDMIFIPLPGTKWFPNEPATLPHLDRGAERLFDQVSHTYETALHKKTSTVSRKSGQGDGKYRIPKESGFRFSSTRKEIARTRRDNEMKRRLLELGIDEHKLFLLMHSAMHNQTLLETDQARKKKPARKDLSVSAPFLAFEKKHKRKKVVTKTVYKYAE